MYISATLVITDIVCEAVIVTYNTASGFGCADGGYGGAFCGFGGFADSSDSGNKGNKDKQRLRKS